MRNEEWNTTVTKITIRFLQYFSRKQKCIYNDCGRSSDLLPYLNAFPSIIDSGQLTVDNILSVSRQSTFEKQWQKCCSIRFFNYQLYIVNCQLKMSLQQRVLLRNFTGFPFIKSSERTIWYQNRCKGNIISQLSVRENTDNILFLSTTNINTL